MKSFSTNWDLLSVRRYDWVLYFMAQRSRTIVGTYVADVLAVGIVVEIYEYMSVIKTTAIFPI